METIKNYLDNMFASLPKTNQIVKMKNDLLANMEDKYNELKRDGKSENEAIGIVISEFGNIDELMQELGIERGSQEEIRPIITEVEVRDYLEVSRNAGKIIGIGVVLCILAPALLILINQLVEDGFISGISHGFADILGLIPLFLLIATAVGLFIYSGMKTERYKYIEDDFDMPDYIGHSIREKNDAFTPAYTLSVIIGVLLCILSPAVLIIISAISHDAASYGVVVLLSIVAIAVYIFIYFGTIKESYKKLLKVDEYSWASKARRQEDRVIGAVASIVWPLAVCIFLISGFIYNLWNINWIVFPITGILFGGFSGAYKIIKGNEKNKTL